MGIGIRRAQTSCASVAHHIFLMCFPGFFRKQNGVSSSSNSGELVGRYALGFVFCFVVLLKKKWKTLVCLSVRKNPVFGQVLKAARNSSLLKAVSDARQLGVLACAAADLV